MFQEANLQYALLVNADAQSANFILSNLSNADLKSTNLTNAYLDYTISTGSGTPELIETEALGKAIDLQEKGITIPVLIKGAKYNKNTKGLNMDWAKKNGAVLVGS